jgi:hypothetical protein
MGGFTQNPHYTIPTEYHPHNPVVSYSVDSYYEIKSLLREILAELKALNKHTY